MSRRGSRRFVADVHLHSRHSRATSKELNPENLHKWSALKGVDVVGTADFTHPEWLAELKEKLVPAEEGLYRLRDDLVEAVEQELPASCRSEVRFLLSVEISSIYKRHGRTRKVHNVVILPDFAAADRFNRRLGRIGNLKSDGRPILGLDSRDLLEISLEVCPEVLFIPAHIWTPHFAVLGASSGFDSMEECFDDLLPHIYAVETGLSSDPPMNGRLSQLDRFAVVSNSDAHSPRKLAREATCFDTELSYRGMLEALRDRDPQRFTGTIEFYPEEGKYHYDGHRKCGVCWTPTQTIAAGGLCPECGRKVTVGVLHRVEKLADRGEGEAAPERWFEYLIPLEEVIGSALGVGPNSKKVQRIYHALVAQLGPELDVLRTADIAKIAQSGGQPLVAEGVRRMRSGKVAIAPGYDGEYGRIEVFSDEERRRIEGQSQLFDMGAVLDEEALQAAEVVESMAGEAGGPRPEALMGQGSAVLERLLFSGTALDDGQQAAVEEPAGPVVVAAGPGSGKTRTLVQRIAHLVRREGVSPGKIYAVTFTNRAADEMRQRLRAMDPPLRNVERVFTGTFHRLALQLMGNFRRSPEAAVIDAQDARAIVAAVIEEQGAGLRPAAAQEQISRWKAEGRLPAQVPASEAGLAGVYEGYQQRLARLGARDYDDILLDFLHLLEEEGFAAYAAGCIQCLLIDEFQDVNAVQYRLAVKLAGDGRGLFVIGDPNQSIYGFRGADPAYFDRLGSAFPGNRRIHLTTNYRSAPYLVGAGRSLIGLAEEAGGNGAGAAAARGAIRMVATDSEMSEAIAVVREIDRLVGGADMIASDNAAGSVGGEYSFGDIAVLFRTGRQAEVLETCFLTEGLPYRLIGQRGFLETPAVRRALAFWRYVAQPDSGLRLLEALRRQPFNPGRAAMSQITAAVLETSGPVDLATLGAAFSERERAKIATLTEAAGRYRSRAGEPPTDLLRSWQQEFGDAAAGEETGFSRFVSLAENAESMKQLLERVVLGQDADIERRGGARQPEAVSLMTMHAAKGLEFPVVLICGVEDGVIPLAEPGRECDEEEERRLFYVAVTRAGKELVLFRARSRMRHGQRVQLQKSRFVGMIPEALVREEEEAMSESRRGRQLSLF